MTYIEGFVTAVPIANRATYRDHAARAAEYVKALGVIRHVETWGDDVPHGQVNDLWRAVDAAEGEAVLFSWFEYPDRATRDAANAKMAADPAMADMAKDMPFDASRMIYGGFDAVSEAGAGGPFGYLDGFVVPVATARRDDFVAHAKMVAALFIEHGASRVVDAWGDDVPAGERTDYARAAHLQDGETVAYGWIEWPSKAARDAGWEKAMADQRLTGPEAGAMDGKRMMVGGFAPILDA